jgi:chemotaxis response regulator CheB
VPPKAKTKKPQVRRRALTTANVRRAHKDVAATRKSDACPIVGIGGSAGGFEATMDLLRHLPAKNGMTFVVVQHLDPHHASKLASLLGKVIAMPVIEVTKTTKANPNTVYVQPPNKCVVIKRDRGTSARIKSNQGIAAGDHRGTGSHQ